MEKQQIRSALREIDKALNQPVQTLPAPGGGVRLAPGSLQIVSALASAKTILSQLLLETETDEEIRPDKPSQGITGPLIP